jgi:hypothetical protein
MKPRHWLGATFVVAALSGATGAHAQPVDAAAQADALFQQAMELRNAGNDAGACPKFLASKQLAPAIGVTLYLADCYQRIGRNASAWREFRDAEKLARARNDKRADVAAQRATALEPTLGRLTVSAPPQAAKGTEVSVDGAALSRDFWGSALAVDPGDHMVTVLMDGQPARTYVAHVDASNPSAVVHVGDAEPPAAPAPAAATADVAPSAEPAGPSDRRMAGRIAGVGLMLAGAAGIGVGTWLVTSKVQEMVNGVACDPHLRAHAIPEAAVGFAAGGVALISGAVVFYVNRPGHTEVSLSPTMVPGGGGAVLRGRF